MSGGGAPGVTRAEALVFGMHVRRRLIPRLAELDGIAPRLDEVMAVFDGLVGADLEFDLRTGPRFASNLCSDNAALEIGVTYGRDQTGVRYQLEPVAPRGTLKNRYTLARDRMIATMRALGESYDEALFRTLWSAFVSRGVRFARGDDATATILAAHHYLSRAPRLKAYLGCDYLDDREHGFEVVGRALRPLPSGDVLVSQVEALREAFDGGGVPRMAGFDFEPDGRVAAKMYVASDGLTTRGLDTLLTHVGGGRGRDELSRFFDTFVDGTDDAALARMDLVCVALDAERGPRLKLYVRPGTHRGDDETWARLRAWLDESGRAHERAHIEAVLSSVAPIESLARTRGAFNYVSVDVTDDGLDKRSVYVVPQIMLAAIARDDEGALHRLFSS